VSAGGTASERLLRAPLTAVMFLTRIPCPQWLDGKPEHLAQATAWFPAVGALVGMIGGAALVLGATFWTPPVAIVLSTIVTVRVTGAFHEDALADVLDGFGGGLTRDATLRIMKDSRVGAYALIGVLLVVSLKLTLLHTLASSDVWGAVRGLLAAHVLGRWSALPLIHWLEYVRDDGTGKPFAAAVTVPRLIGGSLFAIATTVAALWTLGGARMGAVLLAAGLVTLLAGRYFRQHLGGMTGDCLGAANQLVEVVTYLVIAVRWPQ
jgi:adenosylcobinamide-GDP ribazoletransferase